VLPSVSSLDNQILSLPPTEFSVDGATNFVNVIAAYMDQVQGGADGTPGIFTYFKPPVIAAIQILPPVSDDSWINNFANAIHLGTTGATFVPGTITNVAWTASLTDIGPVSITSLNTALSTLKSGLSLATSKNNPAQPMAQAIHDYAMAFIFQTTGLVLALPGPPVPLTLTFNAQ
jgi:hypothetical protein